MRIGGKKKTILTFDAFNENSESANKEFLANLEYWKYLPELNVLRHQRANYDVDFKQINDDASLCHWIMRIYNKQWMEEAAVLEFLDFASIYREFNVENYSQENIKKYLK